MKKIFEYRNNNMSKRKSIISRITFVSVLFLAAVLISCNAGLSEKPDVNESDSKVSEYVQIGFKLSVPEFETRKAIPNSSSYSNMVYVLTGISDGAQEETLGTWGSLTQLRNATLTIHTGSWKFTLTSYLNTSSSYYDYDYGYSSSSVGYDSEKPVLQDTIELILTQSSTISFTLKEVENCKVNGSFEYTVNYNDSRSENWSLSAKLLNAEDLSETGYRVSYSTYSSYTIFSNSSLPSGNYLLQIQFVYKNGDASFESYTMPLIQIAAGLKTTGSKTLSADELTRFYSINYNYLEDGVMPENYATTYTPYNAVILANPTKTNYKFLGWYYSDNFTDDNKLPVNSQGKYVLNQNHDLSGEVYVYARWLKVDYEQDGFEWHLSDEGVLTISGEGEVPFAAYNFPEWVNATSVVVEEGITGFHYYNYYNVGFGSATSYYGETNGKTNGYGRNIKTISLPSTLTSIPNQCFDCLSSLEEINIPENVVSIGEYAFYGCSSLSSPFTLPQSLRSIGEEAFSGCTRISSITIPSGLLTLYRSAFRGWTNSQAITLDWNSDDETERTINGINNNYTDGPNAHYKDGVAAWFSWYLSTAGILTIRGNGEVPFVPSEEWKNAINVIVEEGVTGFAYGDWRYGLYGFSDYYDGRKRGYTSNIKKIVLPSTLTSIIQNCFYGCSSLEEINIPSGVIDISSNAFAECSSLKSITIPQSVESIGERAFYGCESLTSFTIPSSVTSLGDYALAYCTGISSITVPATVTEQFNKNVFQGWRSNQTITLDWNSNDSTHAMPYISTNYHGYAATGNYGWAAGYNGTHAKYRNNVYAWNGCALNEDGTAIIVSGEGQHYPYNPEIDLTNVTSIIVTEGITSLVSCWNISENNQTVKTISLPSTLTGIGDYTFNGYEGIEEITIPSTVTAIARWAFRNCTSLKSITIPSGVESIRENTFDGCNSLETVTIPNSVTRIYEYAFRNCTSLEGITLPDSLEQIDQYAFKDCASLVSVNFNNASVAIPEECFAGCTSLSAVTGTSAITSIGNNAFRGCTKLSTISLPTTLTSIGEYAFYKCTGFTRLTIPSSVTEINTCAFDYCTSSQNITLDWNTNDETERTIASDAFGYAGVNVTYKNGVAYGD